MLYNLHMMMKFYSINETSLFIFRVFISGENDGSSEFSSEENSQWVERVGQFVLVCDVFLVRVHLQRTNKRLSQKKIDFPAVSGVVYKNNGKTQSKEGTYETRRKKYGSRAKKKRPTVEME